MQRYSSCKQSHENMLLMCMIFFSFALGVISWNVQLRGSEAAFKVI